MGALRGGLQGVGVLPAEVCCGGGAGKKEQSQEESSKCIRTSGAWAWLSGNSDKDSCVTHTRKENDQDSPVRLNTEGQC